MERDSEQCQGFLYSAETCARRTLFALMKTLASNEDKNENKNGKREISDTHSDYEFENLQVSGVLFRVKEIDGLSLQYLYKQNEPVVGKYIPVYALIT